MIDNTFKYNSGTKGIIYLDFLSRINYEAVFINNYFESNGAFLTGGAIYLRARTTPGYSVTSSSSVGANI